MKKKVFLMAMMLWGMAFLTQCDKCDISELNILGVPLYAQQTNMWCWAASGEMIMDFLGDDIAQCTQANNRFSRKDCCNSPTPGACAQGGWPEYAKYNYTFSSTSWGTALTWNQLKNQIDSNKPIGFSWGWTGGGGHYMVACGYMVMNGEEYVLKNDPWPWNSDKTAGGETEWITYDEFVSSTTHTHWKDDYDITSN